MILINVQTMSQVYQRVALHRQPISFLKYLPLVNVFISACNDRIVKFWRVKQRKPTVFITFKIEKDICDAMVITSPKESTTIERFLLIFKSGESEIFEFDSADNSLHWIESEKTREHDTQLTGFDYNSTLGLILTADQGGNIKVWTRSKKFLREFTLPTRVDSVCFLNSAGDILVSHA